MLDLTPAGRGNFHPQLSYGYCGVLTAEMAKMTHAVQLRAAMLESISILTMAFTAPATAPASPIARAFDPIAVDISMTTQMARHGIPGLALAITHGDQVGHVRGYGQA